MADYQFNISNARTIGQFAEAMPESGDLILIMQNGATKKAKVEKNYCQKLVKASIQL